MITDCNLAFKYAGIELDFQGVGMDEKGVDKIIDKQVKEREHRRRKRLEEHKRKKLLK